MHTAVWALLPRVCHRPPPRRPAHAAVTSFPIHALAGSPRDSNDDTILQSRLPHRSTVTISPTVQKSYNLELISIPPYSFYVQLVQSSRNEYLKLKARVENLQRA